MKKVYRPALLALILAATQACTQPVAQQSPVQQQTAKAGPVRVEVQQTDSGYQLLRGGKPYYIKGAGGSQYMDRLAAYGGNSIRTWSTQNAQQVLDEAAQHGLTVTMGLDVARERHGFDYNDKTAVAEQLERLRAEVLKYKDHPALLLWGIGNELNLNYTNPAVWDAVNDIAKMIHEVDPNHPATTMLAGLNQKEVNHIKAKCPALDLLSIQAYGDLPTIPGKVDTYGWNGPYIITEWGPTGHWEGPQTPWKASVEETSGEKAAVYARRYQATMLKDRDQCLGSYVFLWGQKQERTPTWYGLFTDKGEETEVVDVMQHLWSGSWPENQAPHLRGFMLNGQKATDGIYLAPGQTYTAQANMSDPDQDQLTYRWELLPESTDLGEGGDRESKPQAIPGLLTETAPGQATLTTPASEGAYRLFVYAYDGHNNVATANIPFFVRR